ncbi:DUF5710 domain-containing protein [Streptomyces sp. NPDC056165]|uniref:DUF5710 domain-containing protein n=1 Tax=Streptomyces sp. NPDC056165 TaxID=3345733 RepID=UPI0035D752D6
MHELHKGAGLPSLATVATELKGAGISRSTIYDAFSSARLPNWHVIDALVEVLGTRHPRTTPEQEADTFYALWLLAVDEEEDGARHVPRDAPEGPQSSTGDQLTVRLTSNGPKSKLTNAQLDTLTSQVAGPLVSALVADGWQQTRERVSAIFNRRYDGRVWLQVPYDLKGRAKEFGARWDPDYKLWFVEEPVPELMQFQVPGPHSPELSLGDTAQG